MYTNLSESDIENILIDNFHRFVIYFQTNNKNILFIEWLKSISSGLANRIYNTNSIRLSIVKSQIMLKRSTNKTLILWYLKKLEDLVRTGRKMMMKAVNLSRRKHGEYGLIWLFYMLLFIIEHEYIFFLFEIILWFYLKWMDK